MIKALQIVLGGFFACGHYSSFVERFVTRSALRKKRCSQNNAAYRNNKPIKAGNISYAPNPKRKNKIAPFHVAALRKGCMRGAAFPLSNYLSLDQNVPTACSILSKMLPVSPGIHEMVECAICEAR